MRFIVFAVAVASADYIDEVSKLGELLASGKIDQGEFAAMKSQFLEEQLESKRSQNAAVAQGKRRSLAEKNGGSKCLASMISDTSQLADDCYSSVTGGTVSAVAALWQYMVKQGGGAGDLKEFISKNAEDAASVKANLDDFDDRIGNLNSEILTLLKKISPDKKDDPCAIVDARARDVGSYGQISNGSSKYYFTSWSRNTALVDGNQYTSVDATNEACGIKTAGKCNKCVKVYGNTHDYHQGAFSMDGKTWVGHAVADWKKCWGHSCSSGEFRSQNRLELPMFWNPKKQGMDKGEWQYFVYSQANGPRRIYDMELMLCPNAGSGK